MWYIAGYFVSEIRGRPCSMFWGEINSNSITQFPVWIRTLWSVWEIFEILQIEESY